MKGGFKSYPIEPSLWDKCYQNNCTHHWNAVTLEKESSSYTVVWNNHREHIKAGKEETLGTEWKLIKNQGKAFPYSQVQKVGLCRQNLTLQ